MAKEKIGDRSFIQFQPKLNQGVTPNLELLDVEIMQDIDGTIRDIESSGQEFSTGQQAGIVRSPVRFQNGTMGFVSFNYALELMFGPAVLTDAETGLAPDAGTIAFKRVYEPRTTRPHYVTSDYGDPENRVQRGRDIFLNSLAFNLSLEETTYTAEGTGQAPLDSVVHGFSPVAEEDIIPVPQKTPDPLRSSVFGALSAADLDTAAPYQSPFNLTGSIAGRWAPRYAMNEEQGGNFQEVLRKRPETKDAGLTMEENDDAWDFYERARANEFWYLRDRVRGEEIVAGTSKVFTVNLSGDDDPTGGVWAMTILRHLLEAIPWNISAAALQALIRSIVRQGAEDVTVGKVGFVYTITFPSYLGTAPTVTTDNGVNLTGGVGDTFAITVTPTAPGVNPITELLQFDMAVASREFFTRGDAPVFAEGDVAMDIPLRLKKRPDLNGIRITTVCRVPDLSDPAEEFES